MAIAQLANRGEVDTRVAAAESLKEIARQSPQDYWSVMETFASHLRRHARVPITRTHAAANSQVTKLAPDIQAILSVLLHRNAQHESHDAVLDLRNTDLSRADLRGIFLRYADLRGAALIGTALCSANLRDANLRAARRKTNGCHAHGTDLSYANLRGADLRNADLQNVQLHSANLANSRFSEGQKEALAATSN